jgi:hypothetical protein
MHPLLVLNLIESHSVVLGTKCADGETDEHELPIICSFYAVYAKNIQKLNFISF